jgi:serine/threonine protein phosphatase PrpC
MKLEIVAFTHTGLVRDHNEDTVAVGEWVRNEPMTAPQTFSLDTAGTTVVLVADGLGGHNAGEVASQFAAERIVQLIAQAKVGGPGIEAVLRQVNEEIFGRMADRPELLGMGTTVAGFACAGEKAWMFHVGDSRGYRLRDGFLAQITVDDVREPAVGYDGGTVRKTGAITQALGGAARFVEILPHVEEIRVRPGAVLLLCSDGLSDMVTLDDMEASMGDDLEATARSLFDRAMAGGGQDNISIVLARFG